ncbi:hypothetical protein KPC_3716 [Acinetobacter stercoris]|uniref:Uncharacterized protein n=1 Tax=Acinetobacter stercoris TaxID=2126983 RepID=A0A2U3N4D4_9GAMM|nr:hypothetical protein KPC_3716 [Acinetobacter stercoris]
MIYNLYTDVVPVKSSVNMHLLYNDKSVSAFRLRKSYKIDYIKDTFSKSEVNTFIYDMKSNKVVLINVIDSFGDKGDEKVDLLQGDQLIYNDKGKKYIYLADIRKKDNKISKIEVVIDSKFKCISATFGCDNISIAPAEFIGKNK